MMSMAKRSGLPYESPDERTCAAMAEPPRSQQPRQNCRPQRRSFNPVAMPTTGNSPICTTSHGSARHHAKTFPSAVKPHKTRGPFQVLTTDTYCPFESRIAPCTRAVHDSILNWLVCVSIRSPLEAMQPVFSFTYYYSAYIQNPPQTQL
jgi:hypothetical protein